MGEGEREERKGERERERVSVLYKSTEYEITLENDKK